ncbi:DUF3231 family protein [Iocasia frigidifontis]|nr:DUF3231 family protein [Iocasia fonsfrigidae]
MLFSKQKKSEKQSQLSVAEVHRIWAKAKLRYVTLNHIQLLSNFVHDKDFKLIIDKIYKTFQKQVNQLEKELNKYSIKSPQPNKTGVSASGNSDILRDQDVAEVVYTFLQFAVSRCMKSFYDTLFNDEFRELLMKITKENVNLFFMLVDYMKPKGWLENPPLYPVTKTNEIVAANEIWELWHHLYFRYINIYQTKVYINQVVDKEFKIILNTGLKLLKKQAGVIEEILLTHGVTLPAKFSENIPDSESKNEFSDDFIFNILLYNMENTAVVHGFALQELVINDNLETFFRELLFDEINLLNNLIRYGKVKGWIPLVPVYRP